MTRFNRALLAALLACMPWVAHAQGYKCKQADGSVSYQDHACAAGTASSSAVPTDLSGGEQFRRSLPSTSGLDAGCQQATRQAMSVCLGGMDTTLKRCQATTMSPACRARMETRAGGTPDKACVQQALGCLSESLQGAQACFQRELPATCRAQIDAARRTLRR